MKIYSEEKWKKVRLEECAVITMGQSPASTTYNYEKEGIPFYQGNADFGDIYPKIKCYCTKPIKIANKEEILLSVRAPVGKINIANTRCCIGRGLCSIKVKENKCEMKFLYYLLKSKEKNLNERANGSTFKAINKNQISEIDFYLPNIEIQKKIVLILDKLVEILRDKKEILLQLEELSKSIFIEMFGDLSINNKNFEMKKIKEIAEIFIGVTYQPQDVVDLEEKGIVVLRSGNIQNFMLDFKDRLKIKKDIREKFFVRSKDILMCSRNGSSNLVGKVAIIDNLTEKMTFGAFMTIIRSEYYTYLYNYFKSSYFKKSKIFRKTTTINQITKIELKNLIIPIPNIELQNQFAERIKIIEKSKIEIQKSIEETQKLFDSLMEKYFG
jgi:type I restriction enzyme S subunit